MMTYTNQFLDLLYLKQESKFTCQVCVICTFNLKFNIEFCSPHKYGIDNDTGRKLLSFLSSHQQLRLSPEIGMRKKDLVTYQVQTMELH